MDEAELIFKRFPEEKQDQVRQLVGYATLMGLSGKDLISIGGKLDRIKQAQERRRNIDIVKSFTCLPIGIDSRRSGRSQEHLNTRFKLKTTSGTYNFKRDYSYWKVESLATKKSVTHSVDHYEYELGQVTWDNRSRYSLLLDIAAGKLVLNF
jgi:hypothetical protein